MRRLERGASYVPLIIVIVLLLVAVVWAYIKTDELDQTKIELAKTKADWESEQARRIAVLKHTMKVADEVGWLVEADVGDKKMEYGSDYDRIQAWVNTSLLNLKEKYVREFPRSVYTVDEASGGIQRQYRTVRTFEATLQSGTPELCN